MNIITFFLAILSWMFFGFFLLAWVMAAWANLRTPKGHGHFVDNGHRVKERWVILGIVSLAYLIAYYFS